MDASRSSAAGGQEVGRAVGQLAGICHHPVADREGALDGLDQPVVVLRRLAVLHVQPFEHPEDQERGEALARRRQVVDGRVLQPDRQRLDDPGAIALQILARDRAADALQIGGDLAPDIATIEIGKARMGEPVERIGELEIAPRGAGFRQLTFDKEGLGEAGRREQGFLLQQSISPLGRADGIAVAGKTDGISQQKIEGQLPAERLG
jgi:hypothetical protein